MLARTLLRPTPAGIHSIVAHTVVRSFSATPRAFVRFSGESETDTQLSDYPDLPWKHYQERDAFNYWDRQGRREFGETLHEQHDILGATGPDLFDIPISFAFKALGTFLGAGAIFCYGIGSMTPASPHTKRSYPYEGLSREMGLDTSDPSESRKSVLRESEVAV